MAKSKMPRLAKIQPVNIDKKALNMDVQGALRDNPPVPIEYIDENEPTPGEFPVNNEDYIRDVTGMSEKEYAQKVYNQSLAGYASRLAKDPFDTNTWLGAAGNQIINGGAGVLGGMEMMFGNYDASDQYDSILNSTTDTVNRAMNPGFNMNYFTSPHGLWSDAWNQFGSTTVLSPAMALIPGSWAGKIGTGIASWLGGRSSLQYLAKAATNMGLGKAVSTVAGRAPGAFKLGAQLMPMGIPEAISEGGNSRKEMLKNGKSEDEARKGALVDTALNVPLLMASEFAEGTLLKGLFNFAGKPGGKLLTRAVKAPFRAIPSAQINQVKEGAEEFFQDAAAAYAQDKPYGLTPWTATPEQKEAFWRGYFGSMPLSMLGSSASSIQRGNDALSDSFSNLDGKKMPSGENGCVEAVVRLGGQYSPFLNENAEENNVDNLVNKAGDKVVPFDEKNLQRGDVIVYGDNDHVVIYDGNGGYYGNSPSQQQVIHGEDYKEMGGLKPTKIIKTGDAQALYENGIETDAYTRIDEDGEEVGEAESVDKTDATDSTKENTETPKETKAQDVTDGLFSNFAENLYNRAVGENAVNLTNEVGDMFKRDGKGVNRFINTPENVAKMKAKFGQLWDAYRKAYEQSKANQDTVKPNAENPHVDRAKEQQKKIIELPEGKTSRERRAQGDDIINQAKGQSVKLPAGLETKLRHGDPDAITASQAIINSQRNDAAQQETVSPEVQRFDEQIKNLGQQLNHGMNRGMRWTDVQAINDQLKELVKQREAAAQKAQQTPAQLEAPKETPKESPKTPADYTNTIDITTIDPASLGLEARKNLGKAVLRRAKAAGVEVSNRIARAAEGGAGDGIRKLQKKVKKAEANKDGKNGNKDQRQEQVHPDKENRKGTDTASESGKESTKQNEKPEDKTVEDKVKPSKEETRKKVIDGILKKTPREAYGYAASPLRSGYRGSKELVQEVVNNTQEYINAHKDTLTEDELERLENAIDLVGTQYGINPTVENKGKEDASKTTGDTDWDASVESMRISSIIDTLKREAKTNPSIMYLNYNHIDTLIDYAKRAGLENDLLDDVKHSSSVKWTDEKVSALLRYLEELRLTTLNVAKSDEELINKIDDLIKVASKAHSKVMNEVGIGPDIIDLKLNKEISDDLVKEAKGGKVKPNEIRKWAKVALTIADKNEKLLKEAIKAYEDLLGVVDNDDNKANALEAVLKDHWSSTEEIKKELSSLKRGLANIPELRKIETGRAEKLTAIADEKEGKRTQAQTEEAKQGDGFNGYKPSSEEEKILAKPFMNRNGKEWTPKEIIDSIVANDGRFIDKLTNGARFVYSKAKEKTSKLWLMEEQPNGVKIATDDTRLPYQAEGYFKHMLALKEKENDGYYGYKPTAKEKKALERPWLDKGDGRKLSDKEIINGLATNDTTVAPTVMNRPAYMLQDQGDHYTIWVRKDIPGDEPFLGMPKGYRPTRTDLSSKLSKGYFEYMFGQQQESNGKAEEKEQSTQQEEPKEPKQPAAESNKIWGADLLNPNYKWQDVEDNLNKKIEELKKDGKGKKEIDDDYLVPLSKYIRKMEADLITDRDARKISQEEAQEKYRKLDMVYSNLHSAIKGKPSTKYLGPREYVVSFKNSDGKEIKRNINVPGPEHGTLEAFRLYKELDGVGDIEVTEPNGFFVAERKIAKTTGEAYWSMYGHEGSPSVKDDGSLKEAIKTAINDTITGQHLISMDGIKAIAEAAKKYKIKSKFLQSVGSFYRFGIENGSKGEELTLKNVEALKKLAAKAGISLEEDTVDTQAEKAKRQKEASKTEAAKPEPTEEKPAYMEVFEKVSKITKRGYQDIVDSFMPIKSWRMPGKNFLNGIYGAVVENNNGGKTLLTSKFVDVNFDESKHGKYADGLRPMEDVSPVEIIRDSISGSVKGKDFTFSMAEGKYANKDYTFAEHCGDVINADGVTVTIWANNKRAVNVNAACLSYFKSKYKDKAKFCIVDDEHPVFVLDDDYNLLGIIMPWRSEKHSRITVEGLGKAILDYKQAVKDAEDAKWQDKNDVVTQENEQLSDEEINRRLETGEAIPVTALGDKFKVNDDGTFTVGDPNQTILEDLGPNPVEVKGEALQAVFEQLKKIGIDVVFDAKPLQEMAERLKNNQAKPDEYNPEDDVPDGAEISSPNEIQAKLDNERKQVKESVAKHKKRKWPGLPYLRTLYIDVAIRDIATYINKNGYDKEAQALVKNVSDYYNDIIKLHVDNGVLSKDVAGKIMKAKQAMMHSIMGDRSFSPSGEDVIKFAEAVVDAAANAEHVKYSLFPQLKFTLPALYSVGRAISRSKMGRKDFRNLYRGHSYFNVYTNIGDIFDAADDSQLIKTPNGEILGMFDGEKIILDPDKINAGTTVHEYVHFWDAIVQRTNPKLWSRGVELLKQTPLWNKIANSRAYAHLNGNENRIASEVHARLSANDGALKLKELEDAGKTSKDIISELKKWVKDVWNEVKSTFAKWSGADLDRLTVEEFNNMPMRDFFGASTAMKNRVASFKRDSKGNPVVEFNISSEEKATHVIDGVEYTFDPKAQRDEMRAQMQAIGMTEAEMKETEEFFEYIKSETIRLSNQHRRFGEWQNALAERIINKTGQLSPVVNAFVANGEYKFNIDLGTSCIRRESRAAALLYLVMEKKIDQIGPAELAAIDDVLRAAGLNIACKCCFVEARRVRQLDSATTVAFQWRAVIEALGISKPQNVIENIADPKSRVGVENELTDDQLERLNMMIKNPKKAYELFVKGEDKKAGATNNGITAARMKEIATIINADKRMAGLLYPQDIMLAQGADKLQRTFYNSGWEGFIKKVDGAGTAKPAHGFAIFDALSFVLNYDSTIRDQDGNLDKDRVISKLAEIYAIGGMRAQSFSDFNVMLAFDYAQMINEMAARQLPIHMYTKVPALIELFGGSRAMFNMSFVPDVLFSETVTNPDGKKVKNPAGLKFHRDENGNVVWFRDKNGKWANEYDYVWAEESFPVDKAYELRDRDEYEGRVGIIAIGVSPEQISKMRRDGFMDMIIPYHSSNMPIEVTNKTGFDEAHGVTDYEEVQHTKIKNPWYDSTNARDSEWISLTAHNDKIKAKVKALKEQLVTDPTTKKQIEANNRIEAEIKSYEAMKLGPTRMEYRYNSILRLVHFMYQQKTNAEKGLVREDSLDKEYIKGMSELLGRDIQKSLGKMSAEKLKKSSDIAADIYLEWCKKLGYTPKFEELLSGEDGKEGYYKVLEDFRGYDKDGNPVPQLPLRLRNIENFSEILEKYIIERSEALDEIERVFSADEETKQKLLDVVKYQRVNRDVRNKMVTRLNKLIGKNNLKIMKTDELLDLLESSEVDPAKVHELRNNKNELYGFTFGGKIYLNEDRFNANTPAHEFTHIWCFAVMKARPDIWKQGKILLRRYHGKSWKRLYKGREAGYEALKLNEDAVASELLSRLVGQESEKITSELLGNIHQTRLKTSGAMDVRIKQWMNKFFKAVRNIFKIDKDKIEEMTMDEFLHAPLSAFWGIGSSSADIIKTSKRRDGTYKESIKSPSTIFKESTKKAKSEAKTQSPEFMLAGERAETAPIANLEKAKLMNKDRKVKFGLNINPGGKANDFVEKILSGLKTVETRTGYAARNYIDKVMSVGDRIGIISNGKIVGYATIAERIIYKDKEKFEAAYKDHLVDSNDPKYGWPKNGDIKVGYRLTDVQRFNYPIDAPAYEKGTPYSYRDISDDTDEGETDESIWKETGWVKGRDGKWRFEIPDNLDAISFDRFLNGKATIVGLGAIYDNPKLYQAYPWLARVKVSLKNLKGILGEADARGIENGDPRYAKIVLDRKTLLNDEHEQRKTLIHEIQHIIQAYEGFARGGAASTFEEQGKSKKRAWAISYNLAGEQESRYVENRADAKQAMEELERLGWQDMSHEEILHRLSAKERVKYVRLIAAAHSYDRVPMPHNADAIITFDGETVAAKYTVDSDVYHYTEGNGKADLDPELNKDKESNNAALVHKLPEGQAPKKKTKHSAEGDVAELMDLVQDVNSDDYSFTEKAAARLAEDVFEINVRLVENKARNNGGERLHGYYDRDTNTLYINRNARYSLQWVFWHEALHAMAARRPDLYEAILNRLEKEHPITQEQIATYRNETRRNGLHDDEVIEEILADAFYDAKDRWEYMAALRGDRDLMSDIKAWFAEGADAVLRIGNNPRTRGGNLLTNEQMSLLEYVKDNQDAVITPNRTITNISTLARLIVENVFGDRDWANGLKSNATKSDIINHILSSAATDVTQAAKDYISAKNDGQGQAEFDRLVYVVRLYDEAWRRLSDDGAEDSLYGLLQAAAERENTRGEKPPIRAGLAGWNAPIRRSAYGEFAEDVRAVIDVARLHSKGARVRLSANLNEQEKTDKSAFDKVVSKFRKALGVKSKEDLADENIIIKPPAKDPNYISPWNRLLTSPARFAEKSKIFATFHTLAAEAMQHLLRDRSFFNRKLDEILGMSENPERNILKSEEEKLDLYDLLLKGDADGKEFTDEQIKAFGYNDNIVKAYKRIRGLIKKMYHMIDDARRAAHRRIMEVDSVGLSRLQRNRFVDEILAVYRLDEKGRPVGDALELGKIDPTDVTGQRFWVLYYGGAFTHRKYVFTDKAAIDELKQNEAIQVDHVRAIRRTKGKNKGNVVYEVYTNEGIPHINWLDGYISHFFHEYMIEVVDADGNYVGTIGSGRTQREAVAIAEEWQEKGWNIFSTPRAQEVKDSFTKMDNGELQTGLVGGLLRGKKKQQTKPEHPDMSAHDDNPQVIDAEEVSGLKEGQKIIIRPKAFNFSSVGMNAANQKAFAVSLHEFNKIAQAMASGSEMTLEEAKEALSKKVRIDGKHRFLGNTKHREGIAGYEKDLDYVLRHYFNIGCRYAALERYFKPEAIYEFERLFGRFNEEHSGLAQYCKEFIQDVNGTPSSWEQTLNQLLMKSDFYRNWVASQYGERAALALGNKVTNTVSMLTLGCWNPSVGLINLTQMMNSIAYIGELKAAEEIIKFGKGPYDLNQVRVLRETGVLDDIGMDNASGYDKGRTTFQNATSALEKIGQSGMMPFKLSESFIRRGTVLAAYEAAKRRGLSHSEAVAYARDINDKSNFNYGVDDAPNIFRRGSIVSQIMLQFKKYPVKELEVMRDMLPFLSDKTTTKQKAMFWSIYFACSGLMGFPIIDLPDDWLDGDLKAAIKKFIMGLGSESEGGRFIASAILYGIPSMIGINASQRVGMSDAVPATKLDLLGAIPSKLVSLAKHAAQRDARGSLRDISPGLYNWFMASEVLASGSSETYGRRGRVINRYEGWYEAFLRAMGFRSMRETINSDVDQIIRKEKKEQSNEKQAAIDRFIANPTNENRKELNRLGIKPEQVKEERRKKKMDKRSRLESELNPKQKRQFRGLLNYAK